MILSFEKYRAFSLFEVIFAITFLIIGVVATVGVMVSVSRTVSASKNNLIAAQLAQEGIEIMRSMRDSNWLSGLSWTNGFFPGGGGPKRIAWNSGGLLSGNAPLKYATDTGYSYASGPSVDTVFRRTVTINQISADEVRLVVEVTWNEGSQTKSIQVEDHLFNWY